MTEKRQVIPESGTSGRGNARTDHPHTDPSARKIREGTSSRSAGNRNGRTMTPMKRKMRRRRRRAKAVLLLIFAGLLLVLFFVLRAVVIQLLPKSESTLLTLSKDGNIRLEEVVSEKEMKDSGLTEKELKKEIRSDIRSYNKKHEGRTVRIRRFSHVDGKFYIETRFSSAKAYQSYSGYACYFGSVKAAGKAGYDLSQKTYVRVVSTKKKEASKGDYISAQKALKDTKEDCFVIEENIPVKVEGRITALTDEATTLKGDTVTIRQEDGNPDAYVQTVILFRSGGD